MRKEIWRILKDLENEKVTTNEAGDYFDEVIKPTL